MKWHSNVKQFDKDRGEAIKLIRAYLKDRDMVAWRYLQLLPRYDDPKVWTVVVIPVGEPYRRIDLRVDLDKKEVSHE